MNAVMGAKRLRRDTERNGWEEEREMARERGKAIERAPVCRYSVAGWQRTAGPACDWAAAATNLQAAEAGARERARTALALLAGLLSERSALAASNATPW